MCSLLIRLIHVFDVPVPFFFFCVKTALSISAQFGNKKCKCSHSACDTFKDAFYYLYPFNIEYSLFASAMAYVMWKNVGRLVEDHSHHSVTFRLKDVCLGPLTGILLVVAGLVTFILYEVYILKEDEEYRNDGLLIHFIMNIVIVSMMSLSTVIGCIVYRLDHREHVSEKNPTRSLDVGLLVGASMGQFIISYFTIVAVVATGARGHLNALNLSWAVLTVLQLGLQNYFIIEGLHREPYHVMREAALHSNAHVLPEHTEMSVVMESNKSTYFLTPSLDDKLSWKRRVLKEVCAFLLLANIIVSFLHFNCNKTVDQYRFPCWNVTCLFTPPVSTAVDHACLRRSPPVRSSRRDTFLQVLDVGRHRQYRTSFWNLLPHALRRQSL